MAGLALLLAAARALRGRPAGRLDRGGADHLGHRGRRAADAVAGSHRPPERISGAMGRRRGRRLCAGSRVRAAMVLVPGAAVLGRDEPRLQALARTFARAGFVGAGAGIAGSAAARVVAARCRPRRLGVAPIAAMAARPAARRRGGLLCRGAGRSSRRCETDPAFIVGIGGYRESEAAIRFVTTGAFRPLGDPREYRRHAQQLRPLGLPARQCRPARRSQRRLRAAGRSRRARFRDRGADVGPLAARLGPAGKGGAGAGRESRSRCGDAADRGAARAGAPRDRRAQPRALRPVQAARPSHPGAWPWRSAGALQREPGAGRRRVERRGCRCSWSTRSAMSTSTPSPLANAWTMGRAIVALLAERR